MKTVIRWKKEKNQIADNKRVTVASPPQQDRIVVKQKKVH